RQHVTAELGTQPRSGTCKRTAMPLQRSGRQAWSWERPTPESPWSSGRQHMRKHLFAVAGAVALALSTSVYAASFTGAGGTAIHPVLSKWADQYAKEAGDTINYQAIGSGGGIKQIES